MTIIQSQQQAVLTLTLQRPDKKNALSSSMYLALTDALQQAELDPSVHVVVLRGQENCFCAGNDLADFVAAGALNAEHPTVMFLHALSHFSKPVVAAVAGLAIGIGTTALLHCDLVYAAPGCRFQLPFTALGLCPEAASSLLLPKLMGHQKASQYLLLGEAFDSEEAYRFGLVNQLVAADQLFALAAQKAQQLAALPLEAVVQSKKLLRQPQQQMVQQVLHQELAVFEHLLHTEACQQALHSFFNRSKS
ncbi:enoyl-CoA hydratase-related protein [Rheinheimera sp.]|uniref:enoyl-CoA hydratase-related protein n=1 Tax=Rheinheimera sp. TaxID=1869214 RepID=UPI0027BAAF53|nr:enoyl-CoA hydratase-related protein [Rheinheimera sp.]